MDFSLSYSHKASEEEVLRMTTMAALEKKREVGGGGENMLVHGDNLPILRSFCEDAAIKGKVHLVYIDPPYSTRRVFTGKSVWYQDDVEIDHNTHAYEDRLVGAEYLEFLRLRLVLLRELLSSDGTVYVHLDDKMAFPAKVLMDEIYGAGNFRNWITRRKCSSKNYTRKRFGNISDYILCYSKSDRPTWNQPRQEWEEEHADVEYPRVEEGTGRRFKPVPIYAQETRYGDTGKAWRGMMPPKGKHWFTSPENLEKLDQEGRIYWSPTGNPRKKVYLDESSGIAYPDIWMDFRDPHNQNVSVTGYPTEKNLDMLKMIVGASSNEGDLVLDCFCGSGTTLEAAFSLGRRWIGVDSSQVAIDITTRRMQKALERDTTPLFGQEKPGFSVFVSRVSRVDGEKATSGRRAKRG